MDRLTFLDSIKCIEYPGMLVDYFDQFIALKKLVENGYADISVVNHTDRSICFNVIFRTPKYKEKVLSNMSNTVIIYNRPISISTIINSETEIQITLQ